MIEDNADMRDYIVESINCDYHTFTAKDGAEGIKIAEREVPDLIISDIMMPKKDGYITTQELRKNDITNHIPIILLTARSDRESRLKGWQEMADEYLTKPFDTEELIIRIVNLLEIRHILKRRFGEVVFEKENIQLESNNYKNDPATSDQNRNQLLEKFIRQLDAQLEKSYAEPNTSVTEIARSMAMSNRQFYRKMSGIIDMTPVEYLRRFRLEKSKKLLDDGLSINLTALKVGFLSQSYFGKHFKC